MVEDSATAEISRSQVVSCSLSCGPAAVAVVTGLRVGCGLWKVWQWLRHCAVLEDGRVVNRMLARHVIADFLQYVHGQQKGKPSYRRYGFALPLPWVAFV